MKKRLDLLLVERNLASSREKAQSLIMANLVLVNDTPATKSGVMTPVDADIRVRGDNCPYVSRGGLKLKGAIDQFKIDVKNRKGLDVGASTGGFCDVLIQEGISKIHALDVGVNQLAWKIRSDPKVVVYEKVNARNLEFNTIGELVDIIVVDVSFISLKLILPALQKFSHPQTDWVTLIKPQFEVGKEEVMKGGIVKSTEAQERVVQEIKKFAENIGLKLTHLMDSPILGTEGNREFLAHWKAAK